MKSSATSALSSAPQAEPVPPVQPFVQTFAVWLCRAFPATCRLSAPAVFRPTRPPARPSDVDQFQLQPQRLGDRFDAGELGVAAKFKVCAPCLDWGCPASLATAYHDSPRASLAARISAATPEVLGFSRGGSRGGNSFWTFSRISRRRCRSDSLNGPLRRTRWIDFSATTRAIYKGHRALYLISLSQQNGSNFVTSCGFITSRVP